MPGGLHEHMKAWEPEEDSTILRLLEELGPKWSRIVKELPGRTVSSVRNRWQRIEKGRKLRADGKESKNRCQQCGQSKRGHVCLAKLKNRGESGRVAQAACLSWEKAAMGFAPPRVEYSPIEHRNRVVTVAGSHSGPSISEVEDDTYASEHSDESEVPLVSVPQEVLPPPGHNPFALSSDASQCKQLDKLAEAQPATAANWEALLAAASESSHLPATKEEIGSEGRTFSQTNEPKCKSKEIPIVQLNGRTASNASSCASSCTAMLPLTDTMHPAAGFADMCPSATQPAVIGVDGDASRSHIAAGSTSPLLEAVPGHVQLRFAGPSRQNSFDLNHNLIPPSRGSSAETCSWSGSEEVADSEPAAPLPTTKFSSGEPAFAEKSVSNPFTGMQIGSA